MHFNGGNFGEFVFFGGVAIGQAAVDFGPGRYFLAGATSTNPVFNSANKTLITGGSGADAGRIFVLTDAYYHGDSTMAAVVAGIPNKQWQAPGQSGSLPVMQFNEADFKSGSNAQSSITLYGLNPANANVPANLSNFTPFLIWQDQHNSYVKYDSDGNVVTDSSCGGGVNAGCPNTPPSTNSPRLQLWAGANNTYGGAVYQPRGAWSEIHASFSGTGSILLVSGAIDLQGGPNLTVQGLGNPVTALIATLLH